MLFEAWLWDPETDRPDYEEWLRTGADSNDPYLVDFGKRSSDIGVVAEQRGRPVGAAWIRAFSNETAQRGFLSENIPELAIAVDPQFRGKGLGRKLLVALIARTRRAGITGISLHVNRRNARALRLYRSMGFVEQRSDEAGPVMFLRIAQATPMPTSTLGCVVCERPAGKPRDVLVELPHSWVTAPSAACLPGYVCVVSRVHVVEPFDLDDGGAWWAECMAVARALDCELQPQRMNYEIHGNTVAHLHLHIFPRTDDDPFIGRPIDGSELRFLRTPSDLERLRQAIARADT